MANDIAATKDGRRIKPAGGKVREGREPCVRCRRTTYAIGKVTTYGPVCNACSPYFRMGGKCARCGKESRWLSKVLRLGIDQPICQACQRLDHGNCVFCRKNRLLYDDGAGRLLCKRCLTKGTTACRTCGNPSPAGRGGECDDCYWRRLLSKRIDIAAVVFGREENAEIFRAFGEWLREDAGAHPAAVKINRYFEFFLEMWSMDGNIPDAITLLERFSAGVLRRNFRPLRFLEEKGLVKITLEDREEVTERKRIKEIMAKSAETGRAHIFMIRYHDRLTERMREGVTGLSSARLALSPALALLKTAIENGRELPCQDDLLEYLRTAPGQRAAVSGFVCMLRDEFGAELALPSAKLLRYKNVRRRPENRLALERELIDLLRSEKKSEDGRRKLVELSLRYFHRVPARMARKMSIGDQLVKIDGGDMAVLSGKKHYWLPKDTLGEKLLTCLRIP
ncbi:MAG: hypothetical protein V1782_12340 [Pseudomonadota bacterium]